MLVLTRKKGESIIIGEQIEVVVLASEGDTVKLGIKAPKQVGVYRKEVYESIRESNQEAASVAVVNTADLGRFFAKSNKSQKK